MLSILTQFLSSWSQHVMVDCCRSILVNIVPGVPHSVLGPLLFLLYTSELFPILENTLLGYVDYSTLKAILCHPQASELQLQSPWTMASARLVSGVTFGEWNWMRVRLRLWSSPGNVQFIPGYSINYWRNCAERAWWPRHVQSDIWFKDGIWEASSISFQSNFLKASYLQEVLGSINGILHI